MLDSLQPFQKASNNRKAIRETSNVATFHFVQYVTKWWAAAFSVAGHFIFKRPHSTNHFLTGLAFALWEASEKHDVSMKRRRLDWRNNSPLMECLLASHGNQCSVEISSSRAMAKVKEMGDKVSDGCDCSQRLEWDLLGIAGISVFISILLQLQLGSMDPNVIYFCQQQLAIISNSMYGSI